uniref:Activator of basal transcription n=2 Tax=Solanum tuberosum TaxID=4113 RepID=M1BLS7_SOLTU
MGEKDLEIEETSPACGEDEAKTQVRKVKKKKKKVKAEKRGVCHVSRVPPRMDHVKLRQVLSQFGEIQRIYLVPEGGFRGQAFSEGWVEFAKKSVAKRVANMLNGQQMGGRKRSSFYYDIWNVKYLSKIKWDDVTDEIAQRHAVREQKLALELSAAKRERDFYLTQVDKSRASSSIEERMKKKQKVQQEFGVISDFPSDQFAPQVIRQFPRKNLWQIKLGKSSLVCLRTFWPEYLVVNDKGVRVQTFQKLCLPIFSTTHLILLPSKSSSRRLIDVGILSTTVLKLLRTSLLCSQSMRRIELYMSLPRTKL